MNSQMWLDPNNNHSVVNPVKNSNSPKLSELALMVSSKGDFYRFCRSLNISDKDCSPVFISSLYSDSDRGAGFSITGPIVSSPYAVMVLETLIAWGAKKILFWGWCGSVSPDVQVGDIIVPSAAFVDEGTSLHYNAKTGDIVKPDRMLFESIKSTLKSKEIKFHEGPIWTTDALFRETCSKIEHFQNQGVLGVEMELSSLFTTGMFRGVELGAILIVSDELSTFKWRPGFKNRKFKDTRKLVCELMSNLCTKLQQ